MLLRDLPLLDLKLLRDFRDLPRDLRDENREPLTLLLDLREPLLRDLRPDREPRKLLLLLELALPRCPPFLLPVRVKAALEIMCSTST